MVCVCVTPISDLRYYDARLDTNNNNDNDDDDELRGKKHYIDVRGRKKIMQFQ